MNFIAKFFEQINGLNFFIKDKNNQNIEIYFFQGTNSTLCIDKKSNKVLYKIDYDNLEVSLSNKEGLILNINGFILNLVIKEGELEKKIEPISNKNIKNNTSDTHTNGNKKYYPNNYNNNNYNKNKLQNKNQRNINFANTNINNTDVNNTNINANNNVDNSNIEKNNEASNIQRNDISSNKQQSNLFYNDPIMQNSVIECKYPYMTACNSCKNKKCTQYDMLHKREDFNFGKGKISEDLYEQFDNYCKNKMEKFKCNAQ